MPWWSKHSSKDEKKKSSKESIIDAFNRKLGFGSEDKSSCRSRKSSRRRRDEIVSERGAISRLPSRSPSPSTRVSRCQSFAARSPAVPLPRPALRTAVTRIDSGSQRPGSNASLPLPKPHGGGGASNVPDSIGAEADFTTASVSSGSSVGDNPSDSILSPLASDCENGNRTALNISSR